MDVVRAFRRFAAVPLVVAAALLAVAPRAAVAHSMTTRSGHDRRIRAAASPASVTSVWYSASVRAARTDSGPSIRATREVVSTYVAR